MSTAPTPVGVRHSFVDNATGLASGVLLVSLGLFLLSAGSVVTGGTAGVALLVSYVLPVPFGVLFVAVNLPFFLLSLWVKGFAFTLRTLACVVTVSLLSQLQHWAFGDLVLPGWFGALMGNVLAGVGLLILFRHGASMGGFNILALIAQERLGWRAGWVGMALDAAVVLVSFTRLDPLSVLVSALGAVALNLIIALNHRPGRYMGF